MHNTGSQKSCYIYSELFFSQPSYEDGSFLNDSVNQTKYTSVNICVAWKTPYDIIMQSIWIVEMMILTDTVNVMICKNINTMIFLLLPYSDRHCLHKITGYNQHKAPDAHAMKHPLSPFYLLCLSRDTAVQHKAPIHVVLFVLMNFTEKYTAGTSSIDWTSHLKHESTP